MAKRIIKTTIFGLALSLATIKILAIAVGSTVMDSILRILSPLGVKFTAIEFGQIIFTAIVTAFIAHLVYTGKLDKYIPKQFKKYIG